MTMNRPFWALSRVKPVSHLFYGTTEIERESACGIGHLDACVHIPDHDLAVSRVSDVPSNACIDCKHIWASWRTEEKHSLKAPNPERVTSYPGSKVRMARLREKQAYLRDVINDQNKEKAQAASNPDVQPKTSEDVFPLPEVLGEAEPS